MTEIRFTCACCGETISGMPDVAFDAPLHFHELPEAERSTRAKLNDDFCVIDGREHFIRAVCPVPLADGAEFFAWGVWVSLSAESFARYRDSFQDPEQSKIGGMFGWLCNRLPGYPETLHLETSVIPQDGGERPLVWLNQAHAAHPLYIEQRNGITAARLGEIYASQMCRHRDVGEKDKP